MITSVKPEDVATYLAKHEAATFCEHVNEQNLSEYPELYPYTEAPDGDAFGKMIKFKIGCRMCLGTALKKYDVPDDYALLQKHIAAFMGLGTSHLFVDSVGIAPLDGRKSVLKQIEPNKFPIRLRGLWGRIRNML